MIFLPSRNRTVGLGTFFSMRSTAMRRHSWPISPMGIIDARQGRHGVIVDFRHVDADGEYFYVLGDGNSRFVAGKEHAMGQSSDSQNMALGMVPADASRLQISKALAEDVSHR